MTTHSTRIPNGWHDVVDKHARDNPELDAVLEAGSGIKWTYSEIRDASITIAHFFLNQCGCLVSAPAVWTLEPIAPRPLALHLARSGAWYAICIAAWRLSLPVVALSEDFPDKHVEEQRNALIVERLCPFVLVTSEPGAEQASSYQSKLPVDCIIISLDRLLEIMKRVPAEAAMFTMAAEVLEESRASPQSVLAYVFTGGTTNQSKCVVVTHSMALHEAQRYPEVLYGFMCSADRFLQYHSVFWGAAAFGELSLPLAFGACAVLARATVDPTQIAADVENCRVTVLGIVPAQLQAAFPGGPAMRPKHLKLLITWADRLPLELGQQWRKEVPVFELLIASEYWLCLSSDGEAWRDPHTGLEHRVFRPVRDLSIFLLDDGGKEVQGRGCGEMCLQGPLVSPGYVGYENQVGADQNGISPFVDIRGRQCFRTKDRLQRLTNDCYVYLGRKGPLTKLGGAWLDLCKKEVEAASLAGIQQICILTGGDSNDNVDVFVEVGNVEVERVSTLMAHLHRVINFECVLHVWKELPRHPATGKVDRKALLQQLMRFQEVSVKGRMKALSRQRRMMRSYALWYAPLLLVILWPISFETKCVSSVCGAVSTYYLSPLFRIVSLPPLWASGQYIFGIEHHLLRVALYLLTPLRFVSSVMVVTALLPRRHLALLMAFSVSYLLLCRSTKPSCQAMCSRLMVWTRAIALGGTIAFTAALVDGVGDSAHVGTAAGIGLLVTLLVMFFNRGQAYEHIAFLLGLNVVFYMGAPKWIMGEMRGIANHVWNAFHMWSIQVESEGEQHNKVGCEVVVSLDTFTPYSANRSSSGGLAQEPLNRSGDTVLQALVDRVSSSGDLENLDSLRAILLVELLQKEIGKVLSVVDVLKCTTIAELEQTLESTPTSLRCSTTANMNAAMDKPFSQSDINSPHKCYKIVTMQTRQMVVDWMLRFDGPNGFHCQVLEQIIPQLAALHPALCVAEAPDEAIRSRLEDVAALFMLWRSRCGASARCHVVSYIVASCLFACWPRTFVGALGTRSCGVDFKVEPECVASNGQTSDTCAMRRVQAMRHESAACCSISVIPVQVAGATVWYLYLSIDHAYADGAAGASLLNDLLSLYSQEVGEAEHDTAPMFTDPFNLLQTRLQQSLWGLVPEHHFKGCCEDHQLRSGLAREMILQPNVAQAVTQACMNLKMSSDEMWLASVAIAMFRLFPDWQVLSFVLFVPLRDGGEQGTMVGYLANRRVMEVHNIDGDRGTLLDIATAVKIARRRRHWHVPGPLEASNCIYMNLVASNMDYISNDFAYVAPGANFDRHGGSNEWRTIIKCYMMVLVLQQQKDFVWDFTVCEYIAAWGSNFGLMFGRALSCTIHDLATNPLKSLCSTIPEEGIIVRKMAWQADKF